MSTDDLAAGFEYPDDGEGIPDEPQRLRCEDIPGGLRAALEAVLMVVEEPIAEIALASALEQPLASVQHALIQLAQEYERDQRGFALRRLAGGWRFYSRADLAPIVESFLIDGRRARITQAALETLAVVAYRQPVSRAQIAAVRGVAVDGVVRTLLNHGLIEEVATDGEHGAARYGTTTYFLQRIGLDSLDDLPPLAPHLPDLETFMQSSELER